MSGLPTRTALDPAALEDIVRRVVQVAGPERIILFGSAARGTMGPHSDVDLLVIKAGTYRKRDVAKEIYRALRDVDEPVEVVVVTPEDVDRYRNVHPSVIKPALREGRVVYAA